MALIKCRKSLIAVALVLSLPLAYGQSYSVRDIRVEGLKRLDAGAVFSQIGGPATQVQKGNIQELIRNLYASELFDDVRVRQEGGVLIINVVERPAIDLVTIKGNKDVNTKQFKEVLRSVDFYEGKTFSVAKLESIKTSLLKAYEERGKYTTHINANVIELPRNRVNVEFVVSEGRSSQIKNVAFAGNKTYRTGKLANQMETRKSNLYSVFSKRDRYDAQKVAKDIESIEKFYQNKGYMNVEVNSTTASITPDQQSIYIDVDINEGKRYKITDYSVVGNTHVPVEELAKLVTIKKNKVYKRSRVEESVKAIQDRLGDDGYALARVNAIPNIDEENNAVSFTFAVDEGERAYVRRINVIGNERTRDVVFRREMRQMEGGLFVTRDVERSKVRIQRLPYVEKVEVETKQVDNDQVDLNYVVKERSAGSITFGISYGMESKFGFNVNFNQPNFMGTGNELSASAEADDGNRLVSLSYTNPYFTKNGVSAGVSVHYSRQKNDDDNTGDFLADGYGLSFNFGYPLTEYTQIAASVGWERLNVSNTGSSPIEIVSMLGGTCTVNPYYQGYCLEPVDTFKKHKNLYRASASIIRDTRDRTVFASQGSLNSLTLSGTLPGSGDEFYKLHYRHQSYLPLLDDDSAVLTFRGEVVSGYGYGKNKSFPFYENVYSGGLRTVRGFRTNTLGPKYLNDSASGGAFRVNATTELIMRVPGFIDNNNLRWTMFLDAGQVYSTYSSFREHSDMRYSAGISLAWMAPIGPLVFSYGKPLNVKKGDPERGIRGDRKQNFQFSIGIPF